jgi:hypothetical protein
MAYVDGKRFVALPDDFGQPGQKGRRNVSVLVFAGRFEPSSGVERQGGGPASGGADSLEQIDLAQQPAGAEDHRQQWIFRRLRR